MKKKILLGALALLLAMSLVVTGCAAPVPPEIAELEKEVAAEKAKVAAEKAKVAELEKEMAGMVSAPEVFELKFSTWATRGNFWMDIVYPAFAENIERMSGGRVTIEVYGAGEVAAAGEVFDALCIGMLDVGIPCPAYYEGVVPTAGLEGNVPGGLEQIIEVETLFWERGWADILRDEVYAPFGLHYLGPDLCYGGNYLVSREPITSLEGIRGLKVRAIPPMSTLLEKLGASVVYVAWGEVYLALATGTIDAASIGDEGSIRDLKVHEFAPYLMEPRLSPYSNNNYLVNMDAWNGLPEDLQHIFTIAARESSKFNAIVGQSEALKAWVEIEAEGAKRTYLPEADIAEMTMMAMEMLDEVAAKDPINAKLVEILQEFMRELGYL